MDKNCLVIIDMQVGFMNDNTKHLIEPMIDFIKNNKFDYIAATRYINHENTACYVFEKWKGCMQGTSDVEVVDELKPFINKTFDKDKYSCWNEEFKQYVKENNIKKLTFVGVNTGCCVLHSVYDAYNDLMECEVISNLCGSTSGEQSHKAALRILRECITQERVI